MTNDPRTPYLPSRIRATFYGWLILDDPRKEGPYADTRFAATSEPLVREINAEFEIEIQLEDRGRFGRYVPRLAQTKHQLGTKTFAQSKLDECKGFIRSQFKRQVTEWEEV